MFRACLISDVPLAILSDELNRRCVMDLLEDVEERVYPVGRLDKDSEGLLLMTNDGNFANGINFSNVLGISCELEMQEAGEGKPAYKIFAPGEVPPASELPNQGA